MKKSMKVEFVVFPSRKDRSEFVAKRFSTYLNGTVLDVGCDEASLKTLLPNVHYVGIDLYGKPDITLNLETVVRLPFEEDRFDCVVCTDVLEHLDNLHALFDEIVRVSRHYTILSLPNCWSVARRPIERGRGDFSHYGLPFEKPADRHKWFFTITEIRDFLQYKEQRQAFEILELFATDKPRLPILRVLRRIRFPKLEHYLNRYAHTLWVVLRKKRAP